MPPPAEGLASRLIVGPALRAQPDRRLVALTRSGYELAFEEIVRRYAKPLRRYATSIVGARAEDVTQDAFSKALVALRGGGAEIELRPWLYRIVRNTALNDLRDRPPTPEALVEAVAGARSAAEELQRREDLADLIRRLHALPEAQRAAIVMRELEGLSHEEIAAALGLSGGAARQAIYRARQTLREGLGLLVPMPVLRVLVEHADDAAGAGGAIAAGAGASSAGGAVLGGLGGGAVKASLATVLVAGAVGAGVAVEHRGSDGRGTEAAEAAALTETGDRAKDLATGIEDEASNRAEPSADGGRPEERAHDEQGSERGERKEGNRQGSDGGSGDSGGRPERSDGGSGSGSSGGQGGDTGDHSGPGSSGSSSNDAGLEAGSDGGDSSGPTSDGLELGTESDPIIEDSSNSGPGSESSGGGSGEFSSSDTSGSDGSP